MRRLAKIGIGAGFGLLGLLVLGVLILTQSDFGRERVRRFALGRLQASAHGIVTMGAVRGNLLTGVVIDGLAIEDSTGAPFFHVDTIDLGYSLTALLRQRVDLDNIRLVRPTVVLDRPPGLAWNFARIFPSDTTKPPTRQGFGAWIAVTDLTVVDGSVTVRNEWLPEESLSEAERQDAIEVALAEESRLLVEAVPGGYQSVQSYHSVNGRFDRLRLANPDSAAIVVDMGELSLLAFPFRPPAAEIRALTGRIISAGDTLTAEGVQVAMPGSRLAVDGTYLLSGAADLTVAARPVAFEDLRWLHPPLAKGSGTIETRVVMRGGRTRVIAPLLDLAMEEANITGNVDVTFGDSLRIGPTEVRFAGIDTDLVRRLAPAAEIPRAGTLAGRLVLAGVPEALTADGNVSFTERDGSVSRLYADGVVGSDAKGLRAEDLRLRAAPIQLSLLSSVADVPVEGTITGAATVTGTSTEGFALEADLTHQSAEIGRSRLVANGAVVRSSESFAARDLVVRLDPVQVVLARAFLPDLQLTGVVLGTATLNGTPAALDIAADLVHESSATGRSRLLASGGVSLGEELRARNLRLRFDPVQVALARAFDPTLAVDGVLTGSVTVTGSTASSMAVTADLAHSGSTGDSRVVGNASLPMGGSGQAYADFRMLPISLATVGLFAPAAGLQGSATGAVQASGSPGDLALSLGLDVDGGGRVDLAGRVDLESEQQSYDLDATFASFDAAAVTTRAPATAVTGTATAVGRGTDPATMTAALAADLTGAAANDIGVDSVRVRARVAEGLATVEQGAVRLASAAVEIGGSFGLIESRNGTLRYAARIDTLTHFSGLVPPDSTLVQPRPAEVARTIARARADSARIARETEVERAATGLPAEPTLQTDPVRGLPRDSLAGSLAASGTLTGNLSRFDVEGTAVFRDLIALGNAVGSGAARYSWLNAPSPDSKLTLDANLENALLAGFHLDSIGARVRYSGGLESGTGSVELAVAQDPDRDYRAQAGFILSAERSQISYSDLTLRFDTVFWRSVRPAMVSWAGGGIEVEGVELRNDQGGLIAVDGRLPAQGDADLRITVESLQVADILGLLQDTVAVRGLVWAGAEVDGTGTAPVIRGSLAVREMAVDTVQVPDVEADFDYASQELRVEGQLVQDGRTLVTAVGRLPINLAVSGVTAPRFAEDAPVELDVRADSLPLESLPSFTEAVEDVRGRVRGDVAVRGTRDAPEVNGVVDLDLGSLSIVQPGVDLREIVGTVRFTGNSLVLDSLTASSNGGPIRLTGGAELPTLTEPVLDLALEARHARVLNNERGTLSASADLEITGALEAAVVAGRVQILGGVIRAPELGEPRRAEIDAPTVSALGDTAVVRLVSANPFLNNVRLDVQVGIARDTWVRNSAANIEIWTPEETGDLDVRMQGGFVTLALNGTVNVGRGEYTVAGRRIQLTQGSVVFLGETPINPILQITAEQQVRLAGRPAFAIQVLVGGTMRQPRITIESNAQPPIAESDLLSYFAFGESTSSLLQSESGGSVGGGSSGGGALLGPVGALATHQLGATAVGVVVDELEQGARRSLGLDVLNITPAPLPAELAVQGYLNVFRGAQFEAGAYLGDRWFIAGQGRTAAVFPGMRLEYRTPSGFEWVTSWEPRYRVPVPSLNVTETAETENVLGVFLQWRRRF